MNDTDSQQNELMIYGVQKNGRCVLRSKTFSLNVKESPPGEQFFNESVLQTRDEFTKDVLIAQVEQHVRHSLDNFQLECLDKIYSEKNIMRKKSLRGFSLSVMNTLLWL